MDGLFRKDTFIIVPRPTSFILPIRWVFTYKFDADGYIDKFKARLCARGDYQLIGSREDVYASIGAYTTLRICLALAAAFDLDMLYLDCVAAFTNADIDDKAIHIEFPQGYARGIHVLLLKKALYGLRQSPLLWF
jgi:hypothetical protein